MPCKERGELGGPLAKQHAHGKQHECSFDQNKRSKMLLFVIGSMSWKAGHADWKHSRRTLAIAAHWALGFKECARTGHDYVRRPSSRQHL